MAGLVRLEERGIEELMDMSLVQIAYEIVSSTGEPYYYRDLMAKVAELRQLNQAQVDDVIARLYTDINIDGRFVCVGDNVWGLKTWYPIEKITDRTAGKRFVRKDVLDIEDDDDTELEEEELLDEEPPFTFGDEDVDAPDDDDVVEDDVELLHEEADDEELEIEDEDEGEDF